MTAVQFEIQRGLEPAPHTWKAAGASCCDGRGGVSKNCKPDALVATAVYLGTASRSVQLSSQVAAKLSASCGGLVEASIAGSREERTGLALQSRAWNVVQVTPLQQVCAACAFREGACASELDRMEKAEAAAIEAFRRKQPACQGAARDPVSGDIHCNACELAVPVEKQSALGSGSGRWSPLVASIGTCERFRPGALVQVAATGLSVGSVSGKDRAKLQVGARLVVNEKQYARAEAQHPAGNTPDGEYAVTPLPACVRVPASGVIAPTLELMCDRVGEGRDCTTKGNPKLIVGGVCESESPCN
jgi:hypothetical protein